MIHSSPSALKALIRNTNYSVKGRISPRLLFVGGEVCDDTTKDELKLNFGADVLNLYGATELGRMAWECPTHEGLHLNAGHFIFECVDGNRPVSKGTEGIATVTSLVAFAMPMIRYQPGDICTLLPQSCSCGRSSPLMACPLGRQDEMVTLPSGRIASPLGFESITRGFPEISRWQVIQQNRTDFEVKLVFEQTPDEAALDKIRERILEYLAEPVRIEIKLVSSLGESHGKFRTFISRIA
jgi:phenylacetate-CoA ligase